MRLALLDLVTDVWVFPVRVSLVRCRAQVHTSRQQGHVGTAL